MDVFYEGVCRRLDSCYDEDPVTLNVLCGNILDTLWNKKKSDKKDKTCKSLVPGEYCNWSI